MLLGVTATGSGMAEDLELGGWTVESMAENGIMTGSMLEVSEIAGVSEQGDCSVESMVESGMIIGSIMEGGEITDDLEKGGWAVESIVDNNMVVERSVDGDVNFECTVNNESIFVNNESTFVYNESTFVNNESISVNNESISVNNESISVNNESIDVNNNSSHFVNVGNSDVTQIDPEDSSEEILDETLPYQQDGCGLWEDDVGHEHGNEARYIEFDEETESEGEVNTSMYIPCESDYNENVSSDDMSDIDDSGYLGSTSTKKKIRDERTLLVYESCLYELLKYCPKCGSPIDRTLIKELPNTGSQLQLVLSCFKNCDITWKSQPTVGNLHGVGNLFLSTSIAFSGIPLAKFERFAWLLNLKFISDSTYYEIRKSYIMPLVKKRWSQERKRMVELLKSYKAVVIVGDGRCDSPGFSAKYLTYTFMDTQTGEVIDTVVVPVTEVANSCAMEKEGYLRVLDKLIEDGVKIDIISTDRHKLIRNLMRVDPDYKHIKHEFDTWHIIKGTSKKMIKAAKKRKSGHPLLEWVPSIVNHFWWCIETCDKNPALMYEKFTSIIYHAVNKHKWPGCKYFKRCAHEKLSLEDQRSKQWLVEGSDAHNLLVSFIKHKNLKNDLQQVVHAVQTTNVEVFNNLLLKYIPKQYHFEYDHMIMGAYLAALEHNFNSLREQERYKTGPNKGKLRYSIAWRKPTKKLIARKIYKKKKYDIFKVLMSDCYKRTEKGRKSRKSLKRVMAPQERDKRDLIIERTQKLSRFQKN